MSLEPDLGLYVPLSLLSHSPKHFLFPFSWLCWYLLMLYDSSFEHSQKGCLELLSICFCWHSSYLAIKNRPSCKSVAARSMWPVRQCILIHNCRIAWLNEILDVRVSFALCAARSQSCSLNGLSSWRAPPCRLLRADHLMPGWVSRERWEVVFNFVSGLFHSPRKKPTFSLNLVHI